MKLQLNDQGAPLCCTSGHTAKPSTFEERQWTESTPCSVLARCMLYGARDRLFVRRFSAKRRRTDYNRCGLRCSLRSQEKFFSRRLGQRSKQRWVPVSGQKRKVALHPRVGRSSRRARRSRHSAHRDLILSTEILSCLSAVFSPALLR